jgi:hypothetical protein
MLSLAWSHSRCLPTFLALTMQYRRESVRELHMRSGDRDLHAHRWTKRPLRASLRQPTPTGPVAPQRLVCHRPGKADNVSLKHKSLHMRIRKSIYIYIYIKFTSVCSHCPQQQTTALLHAVADSVQLSFAAVQSTGIACVSATTACQPDQYELTSLDLTAVPPQPLRCADYTTCTCVPERPISHVAGL